MDAAGNKSYDLYMHVGVGSANSIEVVDSVSGVIFNGMSGDGSKVFFTTPDSLAGDTDTSSDLFVADVTGTSTITRLSTGSGSGNSDACAPAGNWNVVSGGPDCSVVGIAGGGGVAEDEGTVYFLSPELLDGATNSGEPDNQPTANQPNLYSVKPGDPPEFVATIDSGPPIDHPAVVNGRDNSETHSYGDFQVTPNGRYAVFSSALPLTGYENMGNSQLFRYDSIEDLVECVSCNPTNQSGQVDNVLASNGLNLTDDGRVFFTTQETFALRDTNARQDVYQWTDGDMKLISAASGVTTQCSCRSAPTARTPSSSPATSSRDLMGTETRSRSTTRAKAEASWSKTHRSRALPRTRSWSGDAAAGPAADQHGDRRRRPPSGVKGLRGPVSQGQEEEPAGEAAAAPGREGIVCQAGKQAPQACGSPRLRSRRSKPAGERV